MILTADFTSIPRLLNGELRLPTGDFLPTTPLRARGESSQPSAEGPHIAYFQPSYRMPDCVSAMGDAFRQPLAGMFASGLAQ